MRIAVTAKGSRLDDDVDPRFGRCSYFLFVDAATLAYESIENPNLALMSGAGIQSAQLIAERDAKVLLTGNCGPNAYETLHAAGIDVIVGVRGSIRDALNLFKTGAFASTARPSVASHFGEGSNGTRQNLAAGMGRGRGLGRGRGMGRGLGRGRGRNFSYSRIPAATNEREALRAEAENLQAKLRLANERIARSERGGTVNRPVAIVSVDACTACGRCAMICPVEAIVIDSVATVDLQRCTGCGACVPECPSDAIRVGYS
jgi:predicted Fe-Mo cluster-binding NifX family protein/ferredoxin